MKKMHLLFTVIMIVGLFSSEAFTQNREIKFEETTWAKVIEKAKTENKLIFLDAFASWCAPCKYLAAEVFTKNDIADFFNQNFINTHFDMEKGEGITLKDKYKVKSYPTLLFINKEGEIVHRSVGSRPPEEFLQLGKDALNPEKQLITFQKKFEAGNRDPLFVLPYLEMLREASSDFSQAASEYLKIQDEKKLIERTNWEIIKNYINDVNCRELKYVIKNKKEFVNKYGEDSVDIVIKAAFATEFDKVIKPKSSKKENLDSLKKLIPAFGYDKTDEVLLLADFSFYKRKKDINNFTIAADQALKLKNTSAYSMNDAAWFVFENSDNKDQLEKAAGWAKKGIELTPEDFAIFDTYANILFKLGIKAEAIKYEEKALELAKKSGNGVADIEKVLEDMKK